MDSQKSNVIPLREDISINPIQHKSKDLDKPVNINELICIVIMIEGWCLDLQEEEETGPSPFYPKRSDVFIKLNRAIGRLYRDLERL